MGWTFGWNRLGWIGFEIWLGKVGGFVGFYIFWWVIWLGIVGIEIMLGWAGLVIFVGDLSGLEIWLGWALQDWRFCWAGLCWAGDFVELKIWLSWPGPACRLDCARLS